MSNEFYVDMYGEQKLLTMDSELKLQEAIYREAHTRLVEAHTHFDDEVKALYKVGCQAYQLLTHLYNYSDDMTCFDVLYRKSRRRSWRG